MLAILAVVAFAIALLLHLIGARFAETAMLAGLLCLALAMVLGGTSLPWRRGQT